MESEIKKTDFLKAQEFLRKARLKLSGTKYRFFGLCLYSIRCLFFDDEPEVEGYVKYENNDVKGFYENRIYINAQLIEDSPNYKTLNMIDIMLHEFNHILRRHDIRKGDRDSSVWNIACDHIIDKSLKRLGLSTPLIDYHIIKEIENDAKYQSEEAVYNWLMKNKNQPNKIQLQPSGTGTKVTDAFWGTNFISYPDLQSVKDDTEINQDQKQAIENYISQVRAVYNVEKERGNIDGNIQQEFEKLLEVVIPWDQVLERAIKKCAFEKVDRRNWKRPNKFFVNYGIYLPGRIPFRENNGVGTLLLHVDSSGSITTKDLRRAGYIIYKSIQYFEKIIVIVADISIHQTKEFRKNNQEEMLEYFKEQGIKGGGGTSHRHVFKFFDKYLEKNPDDLSLCISITDMYSDIDASLKEYKFHNITPLILISTSNTKINSGNVTTININ